MKLPENEMISTEVKCSDLFASQFSSFALHLCGSLPNQNISCMSLAFSFCAFPFICLSFVYFAVTIFNLLVIFDKIGFIASVSM